MMKNMLATILLILISVSCVTTKKSSFPEDKIFKTRRYVGVFIDYRQTGPKNFGEPNLIWIKTNMDGIFGKISAYSKDCRFTAGDRLFVRKIYYSPGGISGYWIYQIESSDTSVTYRLTEFQYDKKKSVREIY
jgi:hypothetical protein